MSRSLDRDDLARLLDHWVAAGIVSAEQADRMRSDVPAAGRPAPSGGSLVTEATGYLGGVIILVALGLVTGRYWADLSLIARLAVLGGSALLLGVAGAAVPQRAGTPGDRLRAVLWTASSAAFFGLLAVFGFDGLRWPEAAGTSFAAAGTALLAAAFWAVRPHPLHHVAVLASLAVLASALASWLPGPEVRAGVGVWAVGLAWAMLAWGGPVRPRRLGLVLGAVAAVVGAVAMTGVGWGAALASGTIAVLVLGAIMMRDLVLLTVASLGTLIVLPSVVGQFFPGILAAALALLVVGLLLVGAAIVTARRRRYAGSAPQSRDWTTGPAWIAVPGAVLLLAVTAVLLVLAGRT